MSRERTTPSPRAADAAHVASPSVPGAPQTASGADVGSVALVRPPAPDDQRVGGKARSLARLAALGLPVPPARAIDASVFQSLRAQGPAAPAGLLSADDLARLDAARAALGNTPFPPGFDDQLHAALAELAEAARALPATEGFAVRSSGATEDRAGILAAGLFASRLRVPEARAGEAIREVLASYLTPAAWLYATREPPPQDRGDGGDSDARAGGGVLIHPFVVGTSFGTCACETAPNVLVLPDPAAPAPPTAVALARLHDAARLATAAHGPSELEWVSAGDRVLFLQLRAYRASPLRASHAAVTPTELASLLPRPGPGWTWDAAHNPSPLTPAQAGLVALVDARCRIGLRQRVVGGYLFYAPAPETAAPEAAAPDSADPRTVFDRVRDDIERRLAASGPTPSLSLAGALDTYVAGYQGLFGSVGPLLTHARRALADLLAAEVPPAMTELPRLLAGVPSIVGQRRQAALAISRAASPAERQDALDAYLRRFGDESGRWDVAEPTLRETPARLLLLLAATSRAPAEARETETETETMADSATAVGLRQRLPPPLRARFDALLARARTAVSVGEDDDALFARLQTAVRHALLRLGRRLVIAGALDDEADVFFLPLPLAQDMDQRPDGPQGGLHGLQGLQGGAGQGQRETVRPDDDLRAIVATNRAALEEATRAPPLGPADHATHIVRGAPGAGGRAIGRAVHHPSTTPPGPDDVLIAATLLPTELPLLTAAALIVETGGPLGHVAAQARERGLPAVVNAPHARALIHEGATVLVDGDRGEVLLLDPG